MGSARATVDEGFRMQLLIVLAVVLLSLGTALATASGLLALVLRWMSRLR